MSRRRPADLDWCLDHADPSALPSARIALALMRIAHRIPSASRCDVEDAGQVIAPVLEAEPRLRAAAKEAFWRETKSSRDDKFDPMTSDGEVAGFDAQTIEFFGVALLRGSAAFTKLFAQARTMLEDFVTGQRHPADANVDILADRLDLSTAEVAFLRLATAHAYSAISSSIFRFVDTPLRMSRALEALTGARGDAIARISRQRGPLAASGLFQGLSDETGGRDLEDKLKLSKLGDRLLGAPVDSFAQMADRVLQRLPDPPERPLAWPHLDADIELLSTALHAALAEGRPGINLLLHGAPGTGKSEFARQTVAELGAEGFVVSHLDEDGDEATRRERLQALRMCQTFAGAPGRSVLVLEEAEDVFIGDYNNPLARLFSRGSTQSKAWMNDLLEHNAHPVIWISNAVTHLDPAYLRRFTFCLEFPASPQPVRHQVASGLLEPLGCTPGFIDAVSRQEDVSPAALANVTRFAQLCAGATPPEQAVRAVLLQHAKASGRPRRLAMRSASTRFDLRYLNVAGEFAPQQVIDALRDGEAATLLFSGPPGTGKTAFAAALAEALGKHLVARTASDINGMYFGESERNVARLFQSCDPASDLLFIDEADVLLGARETAHQRADRAVTGEFLRWLEAFDGVFACATNHVGDFDRALMRRFTFRMEFRPLTREQRLDLFAEQALGWTPAKADQLPLPPGAAEALGRLTALTAGDFANVGRRLRLLRTGGVLHWLSELSAEHAQKKAANSRPIGFV